MIDGLEKIITHFEAIVSIASAAPVDRTSRLRHKRCELLIIKIALSYRFMKMKVPPVPYFEGAYT